MVRVAVIDDDVEFVRMLGAVFADEGWEMVSIGDTAGAVPFLEASEPDVIVLDVHLEREEAGWAFLRRLHEDLPALRDIPIVVCSADTRQTAEHAQWLTRYGIPTLTKPIDIDEVVSLIRSLLEQRLNQPVR